MSVHGEINNQVTLTLALGAGYAGLATVGYKLCNGDGTQFQQQTTTGVAETAVLGTYRVRVASTVFTAAFNGYVEWDIAGTKVAAEDIFVTDMAVLFAALTAAVAAVNVLATAIKTKTDLLPTDPADESALAALIADAQTVLAAIRTVTDQLPLIRVPA